MLPEPALDPPEIRATALSVDRFGNVQLNLDGDQLARVGAVPGRRVELRLQEGRRPAVVVRTFSDVAAGDAVLYENSYGRIGIAISRGNAARELDLRPGETVWIDVS